MEGTRSNSQPFEEAHVVPRDRSLDDASVGKGQTEEGENVERGQTFAVFAHRGKGDELLETVNVEIVGIILVLIAGVSVDKGVEGSDESVLTRVVSEIIAFEIMNEDEAADIFDAGNLPAFIEARRHCEHLVRRVSHNFATTCTSFCPNCYVVIASNPELKVTLSFYHFVISLLIISELFHVFEILSQLTAANRKKKIQKVWSNY
jgi:hypothetical protein